ncbi:uncharacterized protein LOC125021407 [Mugil cephalus]|uniref:uncharacterized protein LOC125021407 n=1 Tax=Mugil cephalus TaxID=48193 RepID=UPI001FB77DB4|nr:uncharacterized protein LOC125021407 [Mugil cephalus]
MKIHVLFVCFVSVAFDRNAVITAQSTLYTKMEGEDFRTQLQFTEAKKSRKYFCRNDCQKEQDLLIETHGNRAKSGRYTIRYDTDTKTVHAVITELTKSDTGSYKVGVRNSSSSLGSFKEFEITVRDLCDGGVVSRQPRVYSATKGGEITIGCTISLQPLNRKFLCREECNKYIIDTNDMAAMSSKYKINYLSNTLFNVTILELTESDSGRYRCGVGRQNDVNTCLEFEITFAGTDEVTESDSGRHRDGVGGQNKENTCKETTSAGKDGNTLLPVVGCVTVVVMVLAVCALLVYKWKRSTGAEYVNTIGKKRSNEITVYDDCEAVSHNDQSHYQELDQCSKEENLYSSMNVSPNRTDN